MEKLLNLVHTKSWTRKKDFILISKINEIYRLNNNEFQCDNQAILEYENPHGRESCRGNPAKDSKWLWILQVYECDENLRRI